MDETVTNLKNPTMNDVADAVRELDQLRPERYNIEWESNQWDPDARYNVEEISYCSGKRMKIVIKGPRSGNWIIYSNYENMPPEVWNTSTNQKAKLTQLKIIDTENKGKNLMDNVNEDLKKDQ